MISDACALCLGLVIGIGLIPTTRRLLRPRRRAFCCYLDLARALCSAAPSRTSRSCPCAGLTIVASCASSPSCGLFWRFFLLLDGVCFALGWGRAGADVQPVGGGGDFRRGRKRPFSPPCVLNLMFHLRFSILSIQAMQGGVRMTLAPTP